MLGQGLSAELVLLRVVSMETDADEALKEMGLEIERLMDQAEAEAEGYLENVAAQIREPGLGVSQVVRRGPAAEVIVDYASQTGIQQIVMATHGYSGISRWRYGSVAERVLQSANVPVLLIRAKEGEEGDRQETKRCQRILVPLDGSEMAEQVLLVTADVARAIGAEMVLLRVVTLQVYGSSEAMWYPGPDGWVEAITQAAVTYLNEVADSLRERGVGVTIATETGPVAETIIRFAEANSIDLVAMCTHGRTGLVRWALGSVADRVLRGGSTPVLLVRARPSHATADSSRI
jgi:nucleotide-binding universal stress UspA family protein